MLLDLPETFFEKENSIVSPGTKLFLLPKALKYTFFKPKIKMSYKQCDDINKTYSKRVYQFKTS